VGPPPLTVFVPPPGRVRAAAHAPPRRVCSCPPSSHRVQASSPRRVRSPSSHAGPPPPRSVHSPVPGRVRAIARAPPRRVCLCPRRAHVPHTRRVRARLSLAVFVPLRLVYALLLVRSLVVWIAVVRAFAPRLRLPPCGVCARCWLVASERLWWGCWSVCAGGREVRGRELCGNFNLGREF